MELNEPMEGHEHATTSLKVVLLIFAIVLIGALAYLISVTYNQPDTTDYTAPSVVDKTGTTDEISKPDATAVDTSEWKTWTRSEQTAGKNVYTIKAPSEWRFFGADSGGATSVRLADERYTEAMYQSGANSTEYDHLFLFFSFDTGNRGSFDSWVTQGGNSTTKPVVSDKKTLTIGGRNATYQVEDGTTVAYYLDMTDIYPGQFLKIHYEVADKYVKELEAVISAINFSPKEADINSATQIP